MENGILGTYSYLYDVLRTAINAVKAPNVQANLLHTINVNHIGSRLSAKTIQDLKFLVEAGYLAQQEGVTVASAIIRNEVSGATETYDELLGVMEDIYDIEPNRKNSNATKRRVKLGSNSIRAMGLLSNRKRKVPKLGLSRRGVKKDIQINLFEEVTELKDEKLASIVRQGTGGAKFIINIYIANPWVASMWYVKKFVKQRMFDIKKLREQGEVFKQVLRKKAKTLDIYHVTNHRVNTYLSEAQHQELYSLWDVDETLAMVADLGMPGVSEGLIYAPIMNKILSPTNGIRVMEHRAGLDWGTSTGANGSATALIIGTFGLNYSTLNIKDEYYHSNAKQSYKNDQELIVAIVDKLIKYVKDNYESIKETTGTLTVYYDWAAALLGNNLNTELGSRRERVYTNLIDVQPCQKYHVPVRIDIVKSLISQGRYKADPKLTPHHWEELEGSMYDDTKKVDNRPTRLNEDDHTLDAMEYLIGAQLYDFADTRYLKFNKLV